MMEEAIGGCVFLLFLIGSPFLVALTATWIVGPVDKAAAARRAPPHFYMIDALAFVALFQIALGMPAALLRAGLAEFAVPIGLVTTAIAAAYWIGGIRSLSRAGVDHAIRRGVFILFILPMAGAGPFLIGGLIIGVGASAIRGEIAAAVLYGMSAVTAVVGLFVARRLTTWVLAERAAAVNAEPTPAERMDG